MEDLWRGQEDKFLAILIESLARAREGPAGEHGFFAPTAHSDGLPPAGEAADIALVGREEHYMDFETSGHVKPAFCDAKWLSKLGAQVISFNESQPLLQFTCPGWQWPLEEHTAPA